MAKKTQDVATTEAPAKEVKPVPVMIAETVITGTVVLHSVDADAAETKTLTINKGKTDLGKWAYIAFCDGKSGKMMGTLVSAINSLLEHALLVLPAAWIVPAKDADVKFPVIGDNKEVTPKAIEDLPADRQAELREAVAQLSDGLNATKGAEKASKVAIRAFALKIRKFRFDFNKAEFAIFCKLPAAGSALGAFLSDANKNAVSEFVGLAGLPDDLFALVPEGKNSPKAVLAWVNGMRGDIATNVVNLIKTDAELAHTGFSAAVRQLLTEHAANVAEGVASVIGVNTVESQTLLAYHWANIDGEERIFDLDAASGMIPRKEGKLNVTKALFGIDDRADELVASLARVYNNYVDAATKSEVAEMKAKTYDLVKNASAFKLWSADEVARHLFNILAGRIDETTEETLVASIEFADIVADKLSGWIMAVGEGSMTVADVLATDVPAGEKPASEGDAEQDADASA